MNQAIVKGKGQTAPTHVRRVDARP